MRRVKWMDAGESMSSVKSFSSFLSAHSGGVLAIYEDGFLSDRKAESRGTLSFFLFSLILSFGRP